MTTIQSLGSLANLEPGWVPASWGWRRASGAVTLNYPQLYRTQPNIRICVDFLARNIAQLGLHTYRRVSDTDRVRERAHPFAQLLDSPNYFTTGYRLRESTMVDLGVWGNAIWVKVRNQVTGEMVLVRVDPAYVTVRGTMVKATKYEIHAAGQPPLAFDPSDIVHFRLPNPESAIWGLSPIETLRDLLLEDGGLTEFRTKFWDNAARPGGVIQRPLEAPEWSKEARDRFLSGFNIEFSGGDNAGKTVVLEDGMTFMPQAQTAEESQAFEFRKLAREDVARAYHIPLPMVGILDHATYSNIKEQHKQLYQDSLGPWLKMWEEDLELQLMPDFPNVENLYVEFNIAEKLAGSFEEQSAAFQQAVGRPWMAPDEARARLNLPSMGGEAEELAIPTNLRVGEQPAALPAGGGA